MCEDRCLNSGANIDHFTSLKFLNTPMHATKGWNGKSKIHVNQDKQMYKAMKTIKLRKIT